MSSTVRDHVRAHGLRQTAVAVGRRTLRLVYLDERLIVLLKELDSIVEPSREGDLRLEDLGVEQLPALSELNRRRGRPAVDKRFARYVEQGFRGFVAYRDEDPVGYYWWVDRETSALYPDLRKLGLGIELGEGDVYGSDFFLLEGHRGGGVAADALFKVESALRERGYVRLWGYVLSNNRPARWIYSTRGYEPMRTIHRSRSFARWRTTSESA